MNHIKLGATVFFLCLAVFDLINHSIDIIDHKMLFSLDNLLLAASWPAFCLGAVLYIHQNSWGLICVSIVLILCLLTIDIYVGLDEKKNIFMLKRFWTDLVLTVVCVGSMLYFREKK